MVQVLCFSSVPSVFKICLNVCIIHADSIVRSRQGYYNRYYTPPITPPSVYIDTSLLVTGRSTKTLPRGQVLEGAKTEGGVKQV